MSAARVAGHINSCLRKAGVAAGRDAKQKRAAEEAEAARSDPRHACWSHAWCFHIPPACIGTLVRSCKRQLESS
jgi:hypothetical protein